MFLSVSKGTFFAPANCNFLAYTLPLYFLFSSWIWKIPHMPNENKNYNFATVCIISTHKSSFSLYSFYRSNVIVFSLVYTRSFSRSWVILVAHALSQSSLHSGDETKHWFEVDEWSNLKMYNCCRKAGKGKRTRILTLTNLWSILQEHQY